MTGSGFALVRGLIAVVVVALVVSRPLAQKPEQRPTFRGGTDVIVVDVQVVMRDGTPVDALKADQFDVFVDGRKRPIASFEFVRAATVIPPSKGKPAPPVAMPPAAAPPDGRILMLAIDEMSFPVSAQWSAREAARRVLAGLAPQDYLGMMTMPGSVRIAPTRDRAAIEAGIKQISGVRPELKVQKFNISAAEASAIKSKDGQTIGEVYARECERPLLLARDVFGLQVCRQEMLQESDVITTALEQQGLTSINGLHDVIDAMASLSGRKTLIVVSAGVPLSGRPGGQPNLDHELTRLARRAAEANVTLYVFYMNVHFLRAFSAEYGKQNHAIFEDVGLFGYGLEKFADAAGGSFSQIEVDADPFVDRMFRETSAYYLIGVPSESSERDGKEHFIRVTVSQRGARVQHRKVVVIPR